MIKRETPKNKDRYIAVNDDNLAFELQCNDFIPMYIDDNAIYFEKTKEIENFIKTRR